MKGKRSAIALLIILCVLQLFLIIFFKRGLFNNPYDKEYWKDRYEHSQYQLPASKRIIGDDGLYSYAGYRVVRGDDPFSINVDKPPAGKYLIGFSILIFNNPIFSGLIFGIGSIILSFLIARRLLGDLVSALMVSLILLLDPLIASQFWTSLYDIIQLFFLLLNILLLIMVEGQLKKKSKTLIYTMIFVGGLFLGIFAEVKPPVILPLLFLLEVIYLIRFGGFVSLPIFIAGLLLGIFLPYVRYVQLYSLLDFFKIHKYMASFYLQSKLKVHFGAIWQVIFLGKFPQITSGQPTNVTEWWLMWPVAVVVSLIAPFRLIHKKNLSFTSLLLISVIIFSLIVYSFLAAYPRYLVLILPFTYLIFFKMFIGLRVKLKKILFVSMVGYGLINFMFFLLPQADEALKVFYYSLSRGYFQDIYQENIADSENWKINREQFRFLAQRALAEAEIEAIEVQELERAIPKWGQVGEVRFRLIYQTRNLGRFAEEKTVKLVKKNSRWKIVWSWDILAAGFRPEYSITTNISWGKRGGIIDGNGKLLAGDTLGYLISVNPEKIDTGKEQDMLELISSVSFQSEIGLQNTYLENVLPNFYVPLATNFVFLTKTKKQLLESFPGVKLEPYPTRLYYGLDPLSVINTSYSECCTRIYSATNYHGRGSLEEQYDKLLSGQNGGETVLLNERGERVRVIVSLRKKDGQDVNQP